jgi:serine/threonine-protein kinase
MPEPNTPLPRTVVQSPDPELPPAPGGTGPNEALDSPLLEEAAVPDKQVGRYVISGEIARGGMGVVLRGFDSELKRALALKVLLQKYRGNSEVEQRFLEEAQIHAQLQHPGIVPIHEIGRLDDGRPFFAMKLIKGQTLADLLQARPNANAEPERFLAVFEQVCQTVAYAHSKRVLHRDLKPSNVMVGSFGEVQVMDWGLAKVLDVERSEEMPPTAEEPEVSEVHTVRGDPPGLSTQSGRMLGTPAYMAPEQARGEVEAVDERADVFGLGALLCVILTGEPPYRGPTREQLRHQVAQGDLADALARLDGSGADPELVRLARACLAPERKDRPRDAGAVAAEVTAYLHSVQSRLRQAEVERARAEVQAREDQRRQRLRRWLAATAAALVLVAGGALLWRERQQARREAEVEAALSQVAGLESEGRWAEAQRVLEWHLGGSGPAALRQKVKQAKDDIQLVRAFDEARLKAATWVEGHFDHKSAVEAYAAVLASSGLGKVGEEPAAVAARIQGSAARLQVVAALDDWATRTEDPTERSWLLKVARQADPDDWRDRLRDPETWGDRKVLKQLADARDVERLPPQTLTALAWRMAVKGVDAGPLLRAAQLQHPQDFWVHLQLGMALVEAKQWEEAIGCYRAALALRPQATAALNNLGNVLKDQGRLDEAIAHYQKALQLDPKLAKAHSNLGFALQGKGRLEEAIDHCQKAIQIDPNDAQHHSNLGRALKSKGRIDEAIAHYQLAIQLDPKLAKAHLSLGVILADQGQVDDAIAEYRQAITIDPKDANAHCNLGHALCQQGRFGEALASYQRGHELGSRDPRWPYPSAQWVQQTQRLAALESELPAVLKGEAQPTDSERLGLAEVCKAKHLHRAAARFYAEAFTGQPRLADDLQAWHRYNAACYAALAATGASTDAATLGDQERTDLRRQALDWLRADLTAWAQSADRVLVQRTLQHWQKDTDLASVRDKEALAKLPPAERDAWQKLWSDVADLLETTAGKK